ncbi:MAG TPA: MBL fold metallo-hydrolase [Chloroflexota bacterium]|nr:MBL fold metallo-hydrolase [Chloroflexota bacterium]
MTTASAKTRSVRLGDIDLALISDGLMRVDGGGMFGVVPRQMWEAKHAPDELNRVAIVANCLLIRDGEHTIVIDTGIGSKLRPRTMSIMGIESAGELPVLLAEQGVKPADVDIVINTHLHFDHAGGNTLLQSGRAIPTFPNATYIAQRGEWEDATHPNERTRASYLAENLLPVWETGRLELIEGDTQITPHVRCVLTPGHTPNHQSILIESGEGERALYLADVAPLAVHMERLTWLAAYDLEPLRTMESKRRLQRQVVEDHTLLIFPHDPEIGMGYLRADSGRFWVDGYK